ncbi:Chitin Synthase, partial [Aspergillus sclerotialis]
ATSAFTVKHFAGEVDYPVNGLIEENGEIISGDLMNLMKSTRSDFVSDLFGQQALQTVTHPKERTAIMQGQVMSKPLRMPSTARRKTSPPSRLAPDMAPSEDMDGYGIQAGSSTTKDSSGRRKSELLPNGIQGTAGQFLSSLDIVKKSLSSTNLNPYFIFCLKPNDRRIANQFDSKCVRSQVQTFGTAEI